MRPVLIDPSVIASVQITDDAIVFKDVFDKKSQAPPQKVPTCRLYLKVGNWSMAGPYVIVAGNLEEIYQAMTGATLGYVGSVVPKYQPLKLNP